MCPHRESAITFCALMGEQLHILHFSVSARETGLVHEDFLSTLRLHSRLPDLSLPLVDTH